MRPLGGCALVGREKLRAGRSIESRVMAYRAPSIQLREAVLGSFSELPGGHAGVIVLGTTRRGDITAAAVADMLDTFERHDVSSREDLAQALRECRRPEERRALRR